MKEDLVTTPLSFEWLLSSLFSKERYHGASGHLDTEAWREQLTRIFVHLQRAIRQTVEGDDFHSRQLQEQCGAAIEALKNAKTCSQLSVCAIEHFTRVSFSLIGHLPNHWEKSSHAASQPANWQLTKYRTITYLHSVEQRVAQIIALADDERFRGRLPSRRELNEQLGVTFGGDRVKFLDWLKSEYPAVYVQIA
jgi:hypothetical protein